MKTPVACLCAVLASALPAFAAELAAAPCCPPPAPTPACCAEAKAPAAKPAACPEGAGAACCAAAPAATPTPACCADKATAAAAKPAVAPCCEEIKPARPLTNRSLYQLDAKWTDDAGRAVALESLRGRPVVVAMFFASCEYACPVLVNDIQRMRALLSAEERERTRVVLVSFDTQRDTPAALRAFRERMGLDASWTLLRGDDAAVQELAMLLGVKYKQDARGQFAHSNQFTVLNAEGEIVHQHGGLMGDVSSPAKIVAGLGK